MPVSKNRENRKRRWRKGLGVGAAVSLLLAVIPGVSAHAENVAERELEPFIQEVDESKPLTPSSLQQEIEGNINKAALLEDQLRADREALAGVTDKYLKDASAELSDAYDKVEGSIEEYKASLGEYGKVAEEVHIRQTRIDALQRQVDELQDIETKNPFTILANNKKIKVLEERIAQEEADLSDYNEKTVSPTEQKVAAASVQLEQAQSVERVATEQFNVSKELLEEARANARNLIQPQENYNASTMTVSDQFIQWVKEMEEGGKFRSHVYNDSGGYPTIGFGHCLTASEKASGKFANGITEAQANDLLRKDIEMNTGLINEFLQDNPDVQLSQQQFDAVASFCFNHNAEKYLGKRVGGKFVCQSLGNLLKSNPSVEQVADYFMKFAHSSGKLLSGLCRRRASEVNMFVFGEYKVWDLDFSANQSASVRASHYQQANAERICELYERNIQTYLDNAIENIKNTLESVVGGDGQFSPTRALNSLRGMTEQAGNETVAEGAGGVRNRIAQNTTQAVISV